MKERLKLTLYFQRKFKCGWLTAWKSARWEMFYTKQEQARKQVKEELLAFFNVTTNPDGYMVNLASVFDVIDGRIVEEK